MSGLAQWKNETTLWGKEFGNRSQRVVPSTRFDPHFGEDVCGTTVGTFFLSRSVPWETSLAPCHGQAYLWWHSQRRRGTGWNWFGKTPLFVDCVLKFIKKSIFPRESVWIKGKPNWSSWRSWPSEIPKKPPGLDMNAVQIRRNRQITRKERRLVLSC